MKKYAASFLFLLVAARVLSQDGISRRIILIGDAGEMDKAQQVVIPDAASRVLAGKTTVIFLGDNIYPRGMALPGSVNQSITEEILRSQYQPLRAKGAAVYFLPGNHDWDRMGKDGLAKIKRQWQFLHEQGDSLLQLIPGNGCPDPVAIDVSDNLTIIAFDSEWWLFPFDKRNPLAGCDCHSRDEILARMDELYYENRHKIILLASHHPFQSYGTHGGKFSFKEHLFPLTTVNKNLYIPLPVVGSLYPILRKTFTNAEDLAHPLYKDMRKRVDAIFSKSPNLVHVAGHEHGLQFIDNSKSGQVQVVSGSGAKQTHAVKGKYSLFSKAVQGYVIADLLTNNTVRFTYYTLAGDKLNPVFTHDRMFQDSREQEAMALSAIMGDSIEVRVRPEYDRVSGFKRLLLGENYRKEFAALTKLPVIRLSEIKGGLTPEKRGGGMQTVSLRLKDKNDKEWVLRNLEKNPDPLLPPELRETFARDLLDDYMSAQHPFAPLVVPPLAEAAGVPHANPIIGIIAPDTALGRYQSLFAGKVALLEEREPIGKSDNSAEMQENLKDDNDNSYDSKTFLRARLLDLLLSDWDRHADQWRWADTKKGKGKFYVPVPRDRDQALYIRQGIVPGLVSRAWVLPTLQGFGSTIPRVKYSLFKTQFVHSYFADQFSHEEWMRITNEFTAAMTDTLIDQAFQRLPRSAYQLRGKKLAAQMKERRNHIPKAMETFYRFANKRVDIQGTDKHEFLEIRSNKSGGLHVSAKKINKEGEVKDMLLDKDYDPSITKEIRLYLQGGNDSVLIDNPDSRIKLRIIGGKGSKSYNLVSSRRKVNLYDRLKTDKISGQGNRFRKHLSNDSSNTAFIPVNLYNITMPLITAGYNLDDGFIFGLGFKHTHQGFRKLPYASEHQLLASHSFSTRAYRIQYRGEWIDALGKADLVIRGLARAPDNTQNFFGRGNNTPFDKSGDFKRFYRARFAIYQAEAGVRWKGDKGSSISLGPVFQFYRYDIEENKDRFTANSSLIGSYDSSNIDKDKAHLGMFLQFVNDTRNNKLFASWGSLLTIRVQGFGKLNNQSRSFLQINPELSLYKSLNARRTIILAERIGGGISVGKTTFYQSQFIGGQENLLGYRQYRFAGQHMLYNNLELRLKLADFASYILPGQMGFTGFFDVGRVWVNNEDSDRWHSGVGGGLYFAPAKLAVIQIVAGYSGEGWYPYFTMGFRF